MGLDAAAYNEARAARLAVEALDVGGVPDWVSGATINQWSEVRSLLDGERYIRRAATGSGTTDPADDHTNYQAASFVRTKELTLPGTAFGTGGTNNPVGATMVTNARTLGVRTLELSWTGRGTLQWLYFVHRMSYARTRHIEVLVDGHPVWDKVVVFGSTTGTYLIPIGTYDASANAAIATGGVHYKRGVEVYITNTTTSGDAVNDFYTGYVHTLES